ncbi:hypothetical protein EMCRGX_G000854 [Ephydatia muelleri]
MHDGVTVWIADYDVVKAAILRRCDITEETYRQRFRASTKGVEETHRELATRLGDQANKWLKDVATVEQIKDTVVLEQFLNCLSPTIRIWIKERKPKCPSWKPVDGVPVLVKAAVSQTLPVSVLLGTDVPELGRLLGVKSPTFGENGRQGVMMVVTRAGARTQEEEEELRRQKEVTSQVTASPVQLSQEVAESQHSSPEEGGEEEATGESICEERVGGKQSSEPIYNLDDDLFAGGRERHTLTRSKESETYSEEGTSILGSQVSKRWPIGHVCW